MRVARGFAVLVGAVVLVAVLLPGVGSSTPSGTRQDCGRVEYVSQLELVFKRFTTEAQADAYRDAVVAEGFRNAAVIPGCDGFRVVVRGMETFDVAVDLQNEARRVDRLATIECVEGKDDVGEIEAVFGHARDRTEANALVSRAAASGFTDLQLESDPCGGFEVMLQGFTDQSQADEFVAEAKQHGFDVVIEKS